MTPYFSIYAVFSFFAVAVHTRVAARALMFTLACLFVVFAGTRFEVGCDWTGYLLRFRFLYQGESLGSLLDKPEPGFHLLNLLAIRVGLGYEAFNLVVSVIYVFCLARFAQIAHRPFDVLILMFPVLLVQLGMSGLRQALALGMLLLAFRAFSERRPLLIVAWILVASAFHTSALIFLPTALIAGRAFSYRRVVLSLLVFAPVAGLLISERFELYEARYIDQQFGENSSLGAWYRYALAVVPFVGFEWKKSLVRRRFPDLFPLMRLFSLITFVLPLVGLVSSVALHRLGFYVLPLSILTMVCVADAGFSLESKRFARALPFVAYGLYLIVWFSSSRHASLCYIPYQSWLIS